MRKTVRPVLSALVCKGSILLLALVWTVGLISGLVLAEQTGSICVSLMPMAAGSRVSIVGLLTSACLPFLLTAFAVFISRPSLFYAGVFCHCLLFSWCGVGIMKTYGSAGWLVRLLLQFSAGWMLPVFCWFCIRCLNGKGKTLGKDLGICAGFAAVICSIDFCWVSPFLVMLIDI